MPKRKQLLKEKESKENRQSKQNLKKKSIHLEEEKIFLLNFNSKLC